MINRRKQHAGDEEDPLLGRTLSHGSSGAAVNLDSIRHPNNLEVPSCSTNQALLHNATMLLPVQRKLRDKSPESPHTQLLSRTLNHYPTSSSMVGQHYYRNETYELQTNGIPQSRAIDLSSSHDSFRHHAQTDFIYYRVQPGDTLQNLSVRYSCPVASIKRLNNLWSDQEFYGLSRLKLPAGKLRLIADVIDAEQTTHPDTSNASADDKLASKLDSLRHSTVALADIVESKFEKFETPNFDVDFRPANLTASVFKDYDLNIEKARTAALSYEESASAIMQTLAQGGNIVDDDEDDSKRLAQREAEMLPYDMSDYGLSYNGLLLFIFIVCLICPLAYVIYLEEKHHDSIKAP